MTDEDGPRCKPAPTQRGGAPRCRERAPEASAHSWHSPPEGGPEAHTAQRRKPGPSAAQKAHRRRRGGPSRRTGAEPRACRLRGAGAARDAAAPLSHHRQPRAIRAARVSRVGFVCLRFVSSLVLCLYNGYASKRFAHSCPIFHI